MSFADRLNRLKKQIGGVRNIKRYENSFGRTREEQADICPPNACIKRILAELEFAAGLSENNGGEYDSHVNAALSLLEDSVCRDGTLTTATCSAAEELLMPLSAAAKEYKLILAGHAHIDMNWMWGFDETVALTVATFKTVLRLMREYPDFCFSQSQASVYKIIDDYAPELKDEIKRRIAEGRWEVTASSWVETDKNMPSGESLMRHIELTKKYLGESWGVNPDSLNIDFSPDTFGHSANIPEIDTLSGVKYMYHCRGYDGNNALYRWRGESGAELLCYCEQYWYNSALLPRIGFGVFDVSRRCAGLKTSLIVYGVGDHGGGPTRRDIESGLEMATWPVFPRIHFGTFGEFFREAQEVREKLPVVTGELNFIFPGCYSTQSRIKRGNCMAQDALGTAEAFCALNTAAGREAYPEEAFDKAWEGVLFTHFHDILTGSCVRASREHAMGVYQNVMACAQVRTTLALDSIVSQVNTTGLGAYIDPSSQAEGAGVGFSPENTPSHAECGSGLCRLFCVFNPTAHERTECVDITVWDWPGDASRISLKDSRGTDIPFTSTTSQDEKYWDHHYFRIAACVTVASYGYITLVLNEREQDSMPVFFQSEDRVAHAYGNYVLENEYLRAEFDFRTGRLVSLKQNGSTDEYIKPNRSGGFLCVDTECSSSNAWNIGRYISCEELTDAQEIHCHTGSKVRQRLSIRYKIRGSQVNAEYSLDKGARTLRISMRADWSETGADKVPMLTYSLPLAYEPQGCLCSIPAGSIIRKPQYMDIPSQGYAAAISDTSACAAILTDGRYGFRCTPQGELSLTLIHSATSPDEYPERGVNEVELGVGIYECRASLLYQESQNLCRRLLSVPATPHEGTLPQEGSLLTLCADSAVISGISSHNGAMKLRLSEVEGNPSNVKLSFASTVKRVSATSSHGDIPIRCDGNTVVTELKGYQTVMIVIEFDD